MRNLFSILNLILCFELMVSPIAPNLSLISVARAEGCPPGLQMDATLNRCLTTAETANVLNATANCGQGDIACYKENAKAAFDKKGAPARKDDSKLGKLVGIAAVAGATTFAVSALKDSKSRCKSPAFYGMIGGALALVVGDMMANMGHAKRLKEIEKDWAKIIDPKKEASGDRDKMRETSIEAQSESFIMLARAEESLAASAKLKQKFFYVASLAFGVTAVISGMEILTNKTLKTAAVTTSKAAVTATAAAVAAASATGGVADPGAVAALPLAQTAAAQTAIASGKKDALDAGEDSTPTGVDALKSAADTATMQKTLGVKVSQKTASAAWETAAQAASASTAAKGPITAASEASKKWEEHTRLTTCEDSGANTNPGTPANPLENAIDGPLPGRPVNSEGIYNVYLNPRPLDIKAELQFMYNLRNSKDMTSFVMNKWEMDGVLKSPVDDYYSYKEAFAQAEPDKTIFEAFKEISMAVIENMSPISSAYAKVEEDTRGSDENNIVGGSPAGTTNPTPNSNGGEDSNASKTYNEIKAKGIDYTSIVGGVVIGGALGYSGIGKKLLTAKGRLLFSGVLTGLTLMMANHAGKQAKASEERAELLRQMAEEFNQAAGAVNSCRSEDRNDPGKPTCYCYTPENQRNNNRGNSAVCQKLWAGISIKPTNYLAGTQSGKVCISNTNKADPTCACKQTKSCMKVGMSGISGLNAGTMSMLGQSLAPVNGIANGSVDAANLNSAALANQAAKMADLVKKIEGSKGMEAYKKNKGKLEAKLMSDLYRGAASLPSSSLLGGSGSSNMPSNPKDAALMLEKELDQPLPTGIAGGDQIMAPTNSPAEEGLEFGMTADQLAEQEGQIAEVMNQDLDYGGNDINQGSKTNIFDVLSNRYQRSGMRRLFDEKGTTEAEKPAATDIAQ